MQVEKHFSGEKIAFNAAAGNMFRPVSDKGMFYGFTPARQLHRIFRIRR